MRRPAPLLNIPAKVYLHFAVITVAITACVALFADSDSQQRFEEQVVTEQARRAALDAQRAKPNKRPLVDGLVDNRSSTNGAEYDGAEFVRPVFGENRILSGDEPTTPWAALGALALPPKRSPATANKLPPVLPPGAPGQHSSPGVAPGPAVPLGDPPASPS